MIYYSSKGGFMISYKNKKLELVIEGNFKDGSPSIVLNEKYETYACLTFCAHNGFETFSANEGCVWLKDWSENEEIAKFLVKEGYFEFTGREIPQNFVVYKEARITEKCKKELNKE